MTAGEVAAALGLHPEAVRKIERRALAKCRDWAQARGLDLSDLLVTPPPPAPAARVYAPACDTWDARTYADATPDPGPG